VKHAGETGEISSTQNELISTIILLLCGVFLTFEQYTPHGKTLVIIEGEDF